MQRGAHVQCIVIPVCWPRNSVPLGTVLWVNQYISLFRAKPVTPPYLHATLTRKHVARVYTYTPIQKKETAHPEIKRLLWVPLKGIIFFMALILKTRTCVIFVFLTVIQGCSLCLDLLCGKAEVNPGILRLKHYIVHFLLVARCTLTLSLSVLSTTCLFQSC